MQRGRRTGRLGFRERSNYVECSSDDFAFDQELLIQAVHFGLVLGDIPVPVRYFPEASSIKWKRSMLYGTDTLKTMGSRYLHKMKMKSDPRFVARG